MFGIFTGVLANVATVIVGTAVGLLFKKEKLKQIGDRIFQVFALYVMVMGVEGALGVSQPLLVLASIIVGVAIGELLDIDKGFNRLGELLQNKFTKSSDDHFSKGFMQASMLFCIGSMTLLGALQSGLENQHSIYLTKSVLDMVSSMTLAMGFGIGVGFSALTILVFQGLLVLGASALAPILTDATVAACVQVGSLFLVGIALNMLGITKLKVANFLPAMFIPMVYQALMLIIK